MVGVEGRLLGVLVSNKYFADFFSTDKFNYPTPTSTHINPCYSTVLFLQNGAYLMIYQSSGWCNTRLTP